VHSLATSLEGGVALLRLNVSGRCGSLTLRDDRTRLLRSLGGPWLWVGISVQLYGKNQNRDTPIGLVLAKIKRAAIV
jgi:hypothetical protein